MERRSDGKLIAVVALVIAVIGLSVGFASISTLLSINGSATVKASDWDVRFSNLRDSEKVGSVVEVTKPEIDGESTTIETYSVNLYKPKDAISYTFDVVNAGTIAAKITSITLPTVQAGQITCTGNGTSATTDAATVCNNLTYTLTYSNGDEVQLGDILGAAVMQDETLVPTARTMVLKLAYDEAGTLSAEDLPADDVAISGLGITITYGQE